MPYLNDAEFSSVDWEVTAESPGPWPDVAGSSLLGRGIDTFKMEEKGWPLDLSPAQIAGSNQGQEIVYEIRKITSAHELRQQMRLKASASFGGVFGNVSARARFARANAANAYSIYLLIRVSVQNGKKTFRPFILSTQARELAEAQDFDLKAFYNRYGDEVVTDLTMGGELYSLFEFKTRSKSESEELSLALDANVGSFSSKLKFDTKFSSIKTSTNLLMKSHICGGQPELLPNLTAKTLIEFAEKFPSTVRPGSTGERVLEIGTTDYQAVEYFPATIDLPYRRNRVVADKLAEMHNDVTTCLGNLKYVGDFPKQFVNPNIEERRVQFDNETIVDWVTNLKHQAEELMREIGWKPYNLHSPDLGSLGNKLRTAKDQVPERIQSYNNGHFGQLSGKYTVQQVSSQRFLDAHQRSSKDWSAVTRPAQNNDTQKWLIEPLGDDTYTIQQVSTRLFLDAHQETVHDYDVVMRPRQQNDTQSWEIKSLGDDTYTVRQLSSGRYLDAHQKKHPRLGGILSDYRAVTRPRQNNDTQKWLLIKQDVT